MHNWGSNIYVFLAKRRLLFMVLVTTGLGLALWNTSGLNLDKSLKAFLPDSSSQLRRSVELMDIAPFTRWVIIQLTAEEPKATPKLAEAADNFIAGLNPSLLKPLESGGQAVDQSNLMALLPALCGQICVDNLRKASTPEQLKLSLAGLKTSLTGSGGLDGFFWRTDPLNLRSDVFRHFPAYQGQPLVNPLVGYPVTPDGRRLLIIIKPQISMNDTDGSKALAANIQELARQLPPKVSAQMAGAHLHTAANANAIEGDLVLTMSLAMVLLLAIYLLLVRNWGAVWLFVTPILAMVAAVVGLQLVFPTVSGLALGFGAAVLGIAGDYAVHVHFAFRYTDDKQLALKHVARPLMINTILCVAGFGVLLFSSIPAIRQLAFFAVVSIVAGLIWAIVILPQCPGMGCPSEKTKGETLGAAPNKPNATLEGGALSNKSWLVFATLLGLTIALGYYVPFDGSIRALGFTNPKLMDDSQAIESTWKLEGAHEVFLVEGNTPAQALELASKITEAWNNIKPGSASSLAGLLPGPKTQAANIDRWINFVAESKENFEQAFAKAAQEQGFSPKAFDPFWKWFLAKPQEITTAKLSEAGLGLLPDNFLAEKNGRHYALVLVKQNVAPPPALLESLPQDRIFQLSATQLERALSGALSNDQHLLPLCIIICLAVLVWFFQSLNLAMLSFLPALGGLFAVFVTQFISGRPLGLAEMAALPLVICLGADYGIVVVSELVENADFGAQRAILVSGLSTISGIGVLALASHPVLHALGQTVFVGLAVAMPASILLLPKIYGDADKSAQ